VRGFSKGARKPFAESGESAGARSGPRAGNGAAAGCAGRWQARNRYFGLMKRGLGTNAGHQTFPNSVKYGCVKMTEAVALIMGLFCAGIFVAHAVDAYLAH
jgi:hypothetical protein